MSESPLFKGAFPYQEDVLALPVADLDAAARWYSNAFGLREVERRDQPHQSVILERDGVRIGFGLTGGDASQDGAAIRVSDIQGAKEQLQAELLSKQISLRNRAARLLKALETEGRTKLLKILDRERSTARHPMRVEGMYVSRRSGGRPRRSRSARPGRRRGRCTS